MSESIVIDLGPKNIKKLNEFNQIIKRVFNGYFLFNDGIIVEDNAFNSKLDKGKHFAITTIQPIDDIPDDKFIYLLPVNIFKTIRDNKKNISQIIIQRGDIFINFKDQTKEKIVQILKDTTSVQKNEITNLIGIYNDSATIVSQDIIDAIYDNQVVTYEQGDYRVRITKELLPALKKDMVVKILFRQCPDPALFDLIFSVDRTDIITYHMYKCVKY